MKHEEILLQKCLEHLNALPEIQATDKKRQDIGLSDEHSDGLVTIISPVKSTDYAYTIVPEITGTSTTLIISYLKLLQNQIKYKLLLVTRYLSNPAIEILLNENIQFIDTAGNIYLNSPTAYVLVRGKHHSKQKSTSPKQITYNALKVIYILLKSPNVLSAPVKEIAIATGVSEPVVGKTLKNLYKLGYLQRQRNGHYRITNYTKLLQRWEMGYTESLRPKLLLGSFTPVGGRKFSEVAEKIVSLAEKEDFLIGGELGAAIATSHLRPQRATLHVKENYRAIAVKLMLKPSPEGEITFMQEFGRENKGIYNYSQPLADPLLIHAELLLENDDRVRETVEILYTMYLENNYKNA